MTWKWAHNHWHSHCEPEIPEELVIVDVPPICAEKNKVAGWFIAWCAVPVNCHPPTVNLYRKREPQHRNESDEKSWVAACFCITLTHWQVVCWNMANPLFLPSPGPAVGSRDSWGFLCFLLSEVAASVLLQFLYWASVHFFGRLSSSFSYLVTSLYQLRESK